MVLCYHNKDIALTNKESAMLKSGLIAIMAKKHLNHSELQVTKGVNCILNTMTDALSQFKRIEIRSFGSLTTTHKPPHCAHNPKTGEAVVTQDTYNVKFKISKELHEQINADPSLSFHDQSAG